MKLRIFMLAVALAGGLPGIAQRNSIPAFDSANLIAGPIKPTCLSRQFSFTEGASCDRKGNVFFTDQPNNKIWEYTTSGKLELWMDSAGRSNGTYFDAKGNLLTCADEHDELWSISPDKKVTILLKDFQGHRMNGPNDVWVSPVKRIYFTDPYYQRDYWDRNHSDLDGQKVYLLQPGAAQPNVLIDNLKQPNGIVGTPDGQYLYVADIGAGKTWRYAIQHDGSVDQGELVVQQGSDGMTLDEKGNIYLTGDGVTVYNKNGQRIAHIPIPEKWTANLCFGGKHKDQLFITASQGLYVIPMKVHGVE